MLWRLPAKTDIFVAIVYVPHHSQPKERIKAFAELLQGWLLYRDKGLVIIGGDFNSRCAMNGDKVLRTCGRQLLNFCKEHGFTIINGMRDCVRGEFSRTMKECVDGRIILRASTLDYVLVHCDQLNAVINLEIVENSGLDSDHKPLIFTAACPSKASDSNRLEKKSHAKWRVSDVSVAQANRFEFL